jgi:hypothetical protein
MLTGLEILIARMKDHPDEFIKQYKWDELINGFGEYFTEEELNAYKAARGEMMRDLFNEAVLKRLAGEEESDIEKAKAVVGKMAYGAQGRYALGTADPRAVFGQSVINDPMLAAKQANAAMQQQAYHTAAHQRVYDQQRSIFGNAFTPFT